MAVLFPDASTAPPGSASRADAVFGMFEESAFGDIGDIWSFFSDDLSAWDGDDSFSSFMAERGLPVEPQTVRPVPLQTIADLALAVRLETERMEASSPVALPARRALPMSAPVRGHKKKRPATGGLFDALPAVEVAQPDISVSKPATGGGPVFPDPALFVQAKPKAKGGRATPDAPLAHGLLAPSVPVPPRASPVAPRLPSAPLVVAAPPVASKGKKGRKAPSVAPMQDPTAGGLFGILAALPSPTVVVPPAPISVSGVELVAAPQAAQGEVLPPPTLSPVVPDPTVQAALVDVQRAEDAVGASLDDARPVEPLPTGETPFAAEAVSFDSPLDISDQATAKPSSVETVEPPSPPVVAPDPAPTAPAARVAPSAAAVAPSAVPSSPPSVTPPALGGRPMPSRSRAALAARAPAPFPVDDQERVDFSQAIQPAPKGWPNKRDPSAPRPAKPGVSVPVAPTPARAPAPVRAPVPTPAVASTPSSPVPVPKAGSGDDIVDFFSEFDGLWDGDEA